MMVAAAVWSLVSEHVKTAIAVQVVDNEEDELSEGGSPSLEGSGSLMLLVVPSK